MLVFVLDFYFNLAQRFHNMFGLIVDQCTENSRNARVALFVALSSARYWETTMQVKIPETWLCSVRENWFSFISSARRLRFHLQHDKDQKVVFLKKRKKKIKKEKWLCFFCEMAVLQLFCIILVSSSTFFISNAFAAYSCPIRDEAFELVTGNMFYPYVLTKKFKERIGINHCYERLANFILWFDRK